MVKLRGRFLLLLMTIFIAETAMAEVSDDLVTNLSCENKVTAESILAAINPQTAYSFHRHIPLKNWSFNVGLYDIANCWSLSHTQRLMFYLGRSTYPVGNPAAVKQALNMIGKYTPAGVYNYVHMVPWNTAFFQEMMKGYSEVVNGETYLRNFKTDVQAYQNRRFHDLDNTAYLNGNRERSTAENVKTMATLAPNVAAKKLSLIILRPARATQHVVIPKYSITRPTGEIDFYIYDSNVPTKDIVVTYSPKTKHFYAPEIVSYFNLPNPQAPIGVFLVDEGDRDQMLKLLVPYYQHACEVLTWARN